MDNPVYALIFSRYTALFVNYTDEERTAFLRKMQEVNSKYIDETLLMAYCRFSNNQYQHIFVTRQRGGLKEFMEGSNTLEDIQFYQHFDTERYLGTPEDGAVMDFSPRPRYADGQPTLFRVTLYQNAPGYYQAPKDQIHEIFTQRQACFNEVGAKLILHAVTDWSNEEWRGFTLEWFPSLPALQQFQQNLRNTEWQRLFQAKSVLGYGMGGTLSPNPWEKR